VSPRAALLRSFGEFAATGLAVLTRLVAALVVTKIVATLLGPAGMAAIGAFQNFTGVVLAIAGAGLGQGVVAALARRTARDDRVRTLGTITSVVLAFSVPTAVVVALLRAPVSRALFGSEAHATAVATFALLVPLLALASAYHTALAGLRRSSEYLWIGVVVAAATAGLAYPLVQAFGTDGALLNPLLANSLPLLLAVVVLRREWGGVSAVLRPQLDRGLLRELKSFPPMTFLTLLLVPIVQLLVRDRLIEASGADVAGYWQAVVKVSESYMLLLGYLVTLRLVPAFAEAPPETLARQVFRSAVAMSGLVAACALLLWLTRGLVVNFLLAPSFAPTVDLFSWYLVGDVVRAAGLVCLASLIATSNVRAFVVAEAVFGATYVGGAWLSVHSFGAEGATVSYLAAASVGLLAAAFFTARSRTGASRA
jgi:PST family polysaccharide transporter